MNARPVRMLASAVLLAGLAACSARNDDQGVIDVETTPHAAEPGLDPIVRGRWLVYFASEFATGTGGGTDLNGDLVSDDVVPVVVEIPNREVTVSGVASEVAEILGDQIYFVVDEAVDGTEWGGAPGMDEIVLLHWSKSLGATGFVDVLDADAADLAAGRMLLGVADDKLFYTAAVTGLTGDETALRFVDEDAPRTPVTVNNLMGEGPLRPRLLGLDAGLLFLALDETVEGVNLNGGGALGTDVDMDDETVLALLDVRDAAAPVVRNVGLALGASVLAARSTGVDDWLIGFLVSEVDQGGEDLNDPALFDTIVGWLPDGCPDTADGDAEDEVLFYLDYSDYLDDLAGPVNTGLPGFGRVLLTDDYVATLVAESDAGCDYDDDGSDSDSVLRWMGIGASPGDPIVPPDPATVLRAVAFLPDDSMGVGILRERFVCVVDEATDGPHAAPAPAPGAEGGVLPGTDLNGDGERDAQLLGWIDPAGELTDWTFLHATPSNSGGTTPFYAGASWMAAEPAGNFLPIAFQESIVQPGDTEAETRNFTCSGAYDDGDAVDTIPVWMSFSGAGDLLIVAGVGYALEVGNPGLDLTGSLVFFRVSEEQHGLDLNQDSDLDDTLVIRNPVFACEPVLMSVSSAQYGPAVFTDGVTGGAFLADEGLAGEDLNADGNTLIGELVVQYFSF